MCTGMRCIGFVYDRIKVGIIEPAYPLSFENYSVSSTRLNVAG